MSKRDWKLIRNKRDIKYIGNRCSYLPICLRSRFTYVVSVFLNFPPFLVFWCIRYIGNIEIEKQTFSFYSFEHIFCRNMQKCVLKILILDTRRKNKWFNWKWPVLFDGRNWFWPARLRCTWQSANEWRWVGGSQFSIRRKVVDRFLKSQSRSSSRPEVAMEYSSSKRYLCNQLEQSVNKILIFQFSLSFVIDNFLMIEM